MGILGLLQYLKNCLKERRLSDYRGKTVAVDSYAWLHKIIKGQAGRQLILGGPNRYRYVSDCLKRITKIQNLGIKVIMVFDGGPLPSKRGQEESRKKKREQMFLKGKQLLDGGDQAGFRKLVDAIDISPDIAYRLIVQLKKKDIEYIVAPYEADAQLAYLSRQGIADVIITEDSDLMAFGAKKMLYKLDFGTMMGSELDLDQVSTSREANFTWFTHCMFLTTCILSGCDYLNQINGIGIKTAQKSINRVTTFRGFLGELGNKSNQVPFDYELKFMKAFLTFRFQRVYCPINKCCVELNDLRNLSKSLQQLRQEERSIRPWSQQVLNYEVMQFVQMNPMQLQFLGQRYSDYIAIQIANSQIHPVTLKDFDVHFAEALTYVPVVPIRTNSNFVNTKQSLKAKTNNNRYAQQSVSMARFLEEKQNKKLDPFSFEYKSLKNGNNVVLRMQEEKKTSVPELRPIKGGLMLRESEGDSDIEDLPNLSSESSVVQVSASQTIEKDTYEIKSLQDEFQQIAENLFTRIFTQEYLKSPFSF